MEEQHINGNVNSDCSCGCTCCGTKHKKSHKHKLLHGLLYTLAAVGAVILGAFVLLYTVFDVRGNYMFETVQEMIEDRNIPRPLVLPTELPTTAKDIILRTEIMLGIERVQFTLTQEDLSLFAGSIGVALTDTDNNGLTQHKTYDTEGNTMLWVIEPETGTVQYKIENNS